MAKKKIIFDKCALCRREGAKLFLKGSRCNSPKCAFTRRDYPPGEHPFRRGKLSEYGIRMREKQRCKRQFGLRERQFRRFFEEAERLKGNTGENLFRLLERRLDNVVYRAGLALSRRQARQFIAHGLIDVNGKRLDRPDALVAANDTIAAHGTPRAQRAVKDACEQAKGRPLPSWLEVQADPPSARVVVLPPKEELAEGFEPQLIVEISAR